MCCYVDVSVLQQCVCVVDWRSTGRRGVTMGNLLRVLYKDDSPAKGDIFVDFESKYQLWQI